MSLSNYSEDTLLTYLFTTLVPSPYVKLHVGDPGEAGTSNPASETTRKVTAFAAVSGGSRVSNLTATWTNYPADEVITHVSLWDAASAGNCVWGAISVGSNTVHAGDTVNVTSGQLTVSLD